MAEKNRDHAAELLLELLPVYMGNIVK